MDSKGNRCKVCDGTGLLSDDEGWQYRCSVCNGDGIFGKEDENKPARIMEVDENNRLLD
ncbi:MULTISPECIES: hypothetical protein [Virgibacillus]|uniref:A2L zinc ribbon domain protein n=2 Tax=Virgibacillus TaxID=84406 RepID=A0A024QEV5_9BACI|nr:MULTISPECIES: hypothetical protein [Virgibacillus]EQB38949.1 hypothetical protein M948_00970 [Virgibacillus sp. CM-4]GGJ67403.1 hypothetical protein GCM10007111_31630 [Virgibacillus kapii]CDQ41073.1 A2L zinc ribbon domain protein [Virgibacillus massiliensis]